jgi:hypothetical protein
MKTILLIIGLTAFSTAYAEKHSDWHGYADRQWQQRMLEQQREQTELMRNQQQMEMYNSQRNTTHINTPYENEMLRQLIERGYYQ